MLFFRQSTTLIYGNTYTKMFFSIFQTVVHFLREKETPFVKLPWNDREGTRKVRALQATKVGKLNLAAELRHRCRIYLDELVSTRKKILFSILIGQAIFLLM